MRLMTDEEFCLRWSYSRELRRNWFSPPCSLTWKHDDDEEVRVHFHWPKSVAPPWWEWSFAREERIFLASSSSSSSSRCWWRNSLSLIKYLIETVFWSDFPLSFWKEENLFILFFWALNQRREAASTFNWIIQFVRSSSFHCVESKTQQRVGNTSISIEENTRIFFFFFFSIDAP